MNLTLLYEYYKINYIVYIAVFIISYIISLRTNKNILYILITIIIFSIYTWIIHYTLHNINYKKLKKFKKYNIINIISWHNNIHHKSKKSKHFKNILKESINTFFSIILLIWLVIIVKLCGYATFIDIKIIMYLGLIYITYHNINQTFYCGTNSCHKKHHKNMKTNYGPNIIDIIMNTTYDNEIEDERSMIINYIILGIIMFY